MVEDYRLNRGTQLQAAEGVFRQDEDYRLTTFKEWLQTFEWDSTRERYEQDAADHDDGHDDRDAPGSGIEDRPSEDADPWAAHRSARWSGVDRRGPIVPIPRTSDHDPLRGTRAVDGVAEDIAEAERAEQLARWHTDDRDADAEERNTTDFADLYGRSA